MNTSALIWLLAVQLTVTSLTIYFLLKILRSGRKK